MKKTLKAYTSNEGKVVVYYGNNFGGVFLKTIKEIKEAK